MCEGMREGGERGGLLDKCHIINIILAGSGGKKSRHVGRGHWVVAKGRNSRVGGR